MYVASVSCWCCKNRLWCCICCNGYTRTLQASILAVSDHGCCMCFIWALHMFHAYVVSVSSECCICFHTYVASVSSRCCICFAMTTHCFPRVSDACCKCFNYFGCMLQMFPLDSVKVDLVLHMLQWTPSATIVCCSCCTRLHVRGCGGGTSGRHGKPCRCR
jgi:hypothetical protein